MQMQNVFAPNHKSLQAQYSEIFNIPKDGPLSLEKLNYGYYAALKNQLEKNDWGSFVTADTCR